MKITFLTKTKGNKIQFIWHREVIIENLKLHNVYGFCVNKDKKIVLTRDKNETRFTLPGGKIKKGETAEQALIREFEEEVQFVPNDIKLLGSLEVKVTNSQGKVIDHHQQIRFVCSVEEPGDFIPEKNGWETVERIFVSTKKLPEYLEWTTTTTGEAIYGQLLKNLEQTKRHNS